MEKLREGRGEERGGVGRGRNGTDRVEGGRERGGGWVCVGVQASPRRSVVHLVACIYILRVWFDNMMLKF